MTDATTDFFEELAARGHEPRLARATGTVRFDLSNGKRTAHWVVTIKKGDLTLSQRKARADCVFRADRGVFDRVVKGELNAMAALVRGVMDVDGDPELIVLFQRLFPGPPGATGRPPGSPSARRKR